jgi:hypothetical protein
LCLERIHGKANLDWSDLRALAQAVQQRDPGKRWAQMQQKLDVDRFLTFMSVEVIPGDWDGYTFARHNYRILNQNDHQPSTSNHQPIQAGPSQPGAPPGSNQPCDAPWPVPEAHPPPP